MVGQPEGFEHLYCPAGDSISLAHLERALSAINNCDGEVREGGQLRREDQTRWAAANDQYVDLLGQTSGTFSYGGVRPRDQGVTWAVTVEVELHAHHLLAVGSTARWPSPTVPCVPLKGIDFSTLENKPAYAIGSVDSALLLSSLLQHEEPMRVTDAAERLGVSVSTAHRLLRMLVYRDFAVQLPDRRYGAGPVLRCGSAPQASLVRLRAVALPYLHRVVDAVGETANLVVLVGPDVRFIATVQCEQVLRVGDRTGRELPAHRTSAGKALLATLDQAALALIVEPLDNADGLVRELRTVRRRGFAVNNQQTEAGLTAVGVAQSAVGVLAGLSVAAPTVRVARDKPRAWAAALHDAAGAIAHALGPSPWDERMTAQLAVSAPRAAVARRRPTNVVAVHSDRSN